MRKFEREINDEKKWENTSKMKAVYMINRYKHETKVLRKWNW